MKARERTSAESTEAQKRAEDGAEDWRDADRMKAVLERALSHQPKPVSLEGMADDDDSDAG